MNRIFLIDIDGTICEDISNADSHLYSGAKPFMDAQKIINKWYHEGNVITFFTARESKDRFVTERWRILQTGRFALPCRMGES